MVPDLIRLFHITAIDNLDAICQSGALICKNSSASQGVNFQNIAHAGAQGARASKPMPVPPGGVMHDYVPFYFAPRSPMLSAIDNGRVDGCTYRQEDILHFETNVPEVLKYNQDIVFYDLNATLQWSTPYVDVREIPDKVAWELITDTPRLDGYCKYFFNRPSVAQHVDRMEKRMAEFCVKLTVPLECITRIGTVNEAKAKLVRSVLQKHKVTLTVDVITDWYFLGQ